MNESLLKQLGLGLANYESAIGCIVPGYLSGSGPHGWAGVPGYDPDISAELYTTNGEVESTDGHVIPGLFAAGELVGGLFYHNYPGGSGLVSGAVLGKLAGDGAGKYVQNKN